MPVVLPQSLPTAQQLTEELPAGDILITGSGELSDINVCKRDRLNIILLNLMPEKEVCEADFARFFSKSDRVIDITLMRVHNYIPKTSSLEHLERFYKTLDDVRNSSYDAIVVTGAPLAKIDYSQVSYWPQIEEILEWGRVATKQALYICWGAQAALKIFHNVSRDVASSKVFGIYSDKIVSPESPLVSGFKDVIVTPHSRYTEISVESLSESRQLHIVAEAEGGGVAIAQSNDGKETFVTGHLEYNRFTLDREYKRDIAKGLSISIPSNYYPDSNPELTPELKWESSATKFVNNWLNQLDKFD